VLEIPISDELFRSFDFIEADRTGDAGGKDALLLCSSEGLCEGDPFPGIIELEGLCWELCSGEKQVDSGDVHVGGSGGRRLLMEE